ncbi:bifunctional phosphoribosylaminoimidazolecarboxamide formyltransferase/IMP cyclohydrolase [Aestuariivirga sp.]|uniref:bifunctional phosphoribosylaminoimidazolecarboxamide formyltransferase/IMP cyclohydrolase n=1 Tax=Aestuariivirga sp. TaxID=2650926 RepID=UPI0039E46BB7
MDRPIRRALLSVSDKTGLIEFARSLAERGVTLLSTGGTAKALAQAGLAVTDVATVTGFPEIMDGRVKTLHPKVHGGLLSVRGNAEHVAAQQKHGIADIDLLVANLYPFEATVARGAAYDDTVENIDVGGPAMIRAAAKNHESVTVIVEPSDYSSVLEELTAHNGATSLATRKRLAAKAFGRTAAYDAAISQWFGRELGEPLGDWFAVGGRRLQVLRYGENPHQQAAVYTTTDQRPGVASARQVQGKELSYNNLNDTDAALECLAEFGTDTPACVIVKHANPCGVAEGTSLIDAYKKALACDPVSAFGGIIALNRRLDFATAKEIIALFTEVIVAPGAEEEAIAAVASKKNLRLLLLDKLPAPDAPGLTVKTIAGGLLVQSRDQATVDSLTLTCVTKRQPTAQELSDLRFAFKVAKHVKSNAIVYARDGATVGIGAGQMSRVDSARIAVRKSEDAARIAGLAEPLVKGSVVASDAFFPFRDGLLQAAEAGATAVIQPGGSIKDDDVIKAADEAGLAMVFTGVRHFRH